ncbi:MAG: hypothetical protein HZA91_09105 [Verrucomicrobia bacterium]|nr:hypothetical protein [Verrucomicrobiota bacterium]
MSKFSAFMSSVMLATIALWTWARFHAWSPDKDWLAVAIWLYTIALTASGWIFVSRKLRISGMIHIALMLALTVAGIWSGVLVLWKGWNPRAWPLDFFLGDENCLRCGLLALGAIGCVCGIGILRQADRSKPTPMIMGRAFSKKMLRLVLTTCLYLFAGAGGYFSTSMTVVGLLPMNLEIPEKTLSRKNGSPVFEDGTIHPEDVPRLMYVIRQHTWRKMKRAIQDDRYWDSHQQLLKYVFVGAPGTPVFVMEPGFLHWWSIADIRHDWRGTCEEYVLSQPPPPARKAATR